MTRYVFLGAGAVGSALGGLLTRQGSEVLLVARGEHARRMSGHGLSLRCPDTEFTVPVPVSTAPDQARLTSEDVLVLTTKTQQAAAAVDEWADVPVHDRAGTVLGRAADLLPICIALNGVSGEEIALRYFSRVFAVCVWFPTIMIEPGEVLVRTAPSRGLFHVSRYGACSDPADSPLLEELGRDWAAAGCLVRQPDSALAWKYRKLLTNLGNVLQALLGDASGAENLRQAIEAEAAAILEAAGIPVTGAEEARAAWQTEELSVRPVPGEPAQIGGSSWQSLVRGTGSIETDFLNGEIALIARRIGRSAPINARLTALARRAARQGLRPGAIGIEELRAELPV
ncbi:ketopantoate reductase family protein [Sciscionella sediminilitoris]|uniref:ketopantoate reductase family protein n=1 Tax=Sciscionella sediminilitoris TaxID=1445613 RepID=UPI0004DF8BA0|nr:2-dehydropantoate 2-reductase N-terminal domain-containing protein [Sciscionella sp. SE31]